MLQKKQPNAANPKRYEEEKKTTANNKNKKTNTHAKLKTTQNNCETKTLQDENVAKSQMLQT